MDDHAQQVEEKRRKRAFTKGLKFIGYLADVRWLKEAGTDYQYASDDFDDVRVPFHDHEMAYEDIVTGERIILHQPYLCTRPHEHIDRCGKTLEIVTQASEKFAEEHGLTVHVSFDESWHYPGETVLVVYRKV